MHTSLFSEAALVRQLFIQNLIRENIIQHFQALEHNFSVSEEDIDYITNFDFNFTQDSLCELEVPEVNTTFQNLNITEPEPLCNLGSFKVGIFYEENQKHAICMTRMIINQSTDNLPWLCAYSGLSSTLQTFWF